MPTVAVEANPATARFDDWELSQGSLTSNVARAEPLAIAGSVAVASMEYVPIWAVFGSEYDALKIPLPIEVTLSMMLELSGLVSFTCKCRPEELSGMPLEVTNTLATTVSPGK